MGNGEGDLDSGDVPSSLASLVPIVIATLQIEEENPRVAYLCEYFSLNFDYFFNLFYRSWLKNKHCSKEKILKELKKIVYNCKRE